MQDGKRWITWRGRRILVNNNGNIVKDNKQDEKEKYFNENFYMQDGDFYEEWRKAQPNEDWNTKHSWGEYKRINVFDKKNNKQVGYLTYKEVNNCDKTSMKDKINVVMIKVDEKYRRKGIATQMYKELQRRAGNSDISFGELTKEGKKLVESIGKITKKQNYTSTTQPDYWGRINL